jgi:hypothetical protein
LGRRGGGKIKRGVSPLLDTLYPAVTSEAMLQFKRLIFLFDSKTGI